MTRQSAALVTVGALLLAASAGLARAEVSTAKSADSGALVAEPGSDGAGDPYFPKYGNGGYDVTSYDIGVTYRIGTKRLTGDTTVNATATQDLSRFNLDLALPVSAVTVNGTAADFDQIGDELRVTPDPVINSGTTMKVRVKYAGDPARAIQGALGGWFVTSDGAVLAGEPEAAVAWFPSNDHPSDKATFKISITTAANKTAVSNGVLKSHTTKGSLGTWVWEESSPMTTYLATAVIGDYKLRRGKTPGGVPYTYAISKHLGSVEQPAVNSLKLTPKVVDFFSTEFGPYPFSSTGGILANVTFPFSLENQTKPVYSKAFFNGGPNSVVVAHELAHMWWGDSVSVKKWRDIWLNEGFATWSSWYFDARKVRGGQSLNQAFEANYRGNDSGFWSVVIGNPGPNRVFDWAVYSRGAMTLQALRNRIGVADFTKLMRTWAKERRHGNASVAEFKELAQTISGEDLGVFFAEWLDQGNRPLPSRELGFPPSMLP